MFFFKSRHWVSTNLSKPLNQVNFVRNLCRSLSRSADNDVEHALQWSDNHLIGSGGLSTPVPGASAVCGGATNTGVECRISKGSNNLSQPPSRSVESH